MKGVFKMKKLNNKKGFTLAELLIVVAIIAVLAGISIPIFNSQLEKAREATDTANLRSAYAVAATAVLDSSTETGVSAGPVAMTQATAGFESSSKDTEIGGVTLSTLTNAKSGVSYYVNVKADGTVTITTDAAYTVVDPVSGKKAS